MSNLDEVEKMSSNTSVHAITCSSSTGEERISSPVDSKTDLNFAECKKIDRKLEREKRLKGKLTTIKFFDITAFRNNCPDFIVEGVLHCLLGSKSQFDARMGRTKSILPILTVDCCQTFSTLSAVLLSSIGREEVLRTLWNVSTVNYLLYISAWLHQLTRTSWPNRGPRPSVSDLNTCLMLERFFPSRVEASEFEVIFYNQKEKVMELLQRMCIAPPTKCSREESENRKIKNPVCGYVIVSGDYTVSVFRVDHQHLGHSHSCYAKAWSLYICDSHGTQPWSREKASVCGVTFGTPSNNGNKEGYVSVDDGFNYFALILCTLLEEHRKTGPRLDSIPYMTWTPITRRRSQFLSGEELKRVMEENWLPKVLSQPAVVQESKEQRFSLYPCFLTVEKECKSSTPKAP